jgi:hypothetical protein
VSDRLVSSLVTRVDETLEAVQVLATSLFGDVAAALREYCCYFRRPG